MDLASQVLGEAAQATRPAAIAVQDAAGLFPTLAVAIEMTMLELNSGPLGRLGDELDLHFARLLGIGFDLELRTQIPAEHHTSRGLVRQHARPMAFSPVHAAVVDLPTDTWFEHPFRDIDPEQVVLRWEP